MDNENKTLIITLAVVLILVLGCFVGVRAYSNLDSPITVVTSGSMEHGEDSQIGVIDTGDMIILRNKDSGITSYVDGQKSGYGKFGESGDVIVYERNGKNPVIHRAILWIDYNAGSWSAPSLKGYDQNLWYTNGTPREHSDSFDSLTLLLPNWSNGGGLKEYTIDLSSDIEPQSGYLTKGDNNQYFDQDGGKIMHNLIDKNIIKAVAGIELPWFGLIKLQLEGKTEYIQGNSWACLLFLIIDVIAAIVLIPLFVECIWKAAKKKDEDP